MPTLVRKPAAAACASTAGGNPASQAGRREDVEHLSRNSNSPGKKQSATAASLDGPHYDGYGYAGDQLAQKDEAPRKRAADQLDEDIASAKKPSVESAAADSASRPRKKKAPPAAVPANDWCVQRIVRDLGRLDTLRRGEVGPDVVSDDEDEKALDNLVRKLLQDADAPQADDDDDDDDHGNIGGGGDDDDYGGAAMAVDDGQVEDEFMPAAAAAAAAPEHYHGDEDGNSIAVVTHDDDDDDGMASMAGAPSAGETEVIDLCSSDDDEGSSEETTSEPEHTSLGAAHQAADAVDLDLPAEDCDCAWV